ncbi:hypothetical protein GCM10027418_14020 [Mariniluteicoccus endophyticus]
MSTVPSTPITPRTCDATDRRRAGSAAGAMTFRIALLVSLAVALRALGVDQVWMNAAIVAVDLAVLAHVAARLRAEGSSLRELLATKTPGRDALVGLGLFVALTVAFFVCTFMGNMVAYQGAPPVGPTPRVPMALALVAVVVMPFTVALAEEVLYRAYALPRLEATIGRIPAVLVVSLLFGVQHIAFALGSPQAMLARSITTLLVGLLLAGLWYATRGRLWSLVVAHWLLDVIGLGLPMLFFALS